MNESRTIKELLQVMYDHIEQRGKVQCLCWFTRRLEYDETISDEEGCMIRAYIILNRPKWYSSMAAFVASDTDYYWLKGKVAPRLKWLKKHIKLNS